MNRNYSKLIVGVVAVAVALGAAVAGGAVTSEHTENQTQETSYLRVAHASPDAPAVNVTLGNETVLSNVSFGSVSEYLRVSAGTYNVTVTPTGQPSTVVFDGNVTVEPRTVTTLAATGEISTGADTAFEPVAFSDDAWTPGPNSSAVSVLHLSPDAPTVDVTVAQGPADVEPGAALAENVSFRNGSEYMTVPAGNYTLAVRQATPGNNGTILSLVNLSVDGGQAYSAIAAGYATVEDEPAGNGFTVVAAEDASFQVTLPSTETGNDTATATPTATPGQSTPTDTDTPGQSTPTDTATPGQSTSTDTATPGQATPTPENGTETPSEDTPRG